MMKVVVSALCLLLPVAAHAADEPESPEQKAARIAINATGKQIDACTQRYVEENPGTRGVAKISVSVVAEGRIARVSVETQLQQSRSLRACLERVAKTWRLPPPKTDKPDDVSLQIPVVKGFEFKIYAPGEEPKAPPPGEKPDGFLQFAPTFLRTYGE